MVREVINNGDAVHLGSNLQTSLYAFKSFKRGRDFLFRDAVSSGQSRGCSSVPDVIFAGQGKFKIRPGFAIAQHRPCGTCGFESQVGHSPCGVRGRAIALYGTECPLQRPSKTFAGVEGDDASSLWDQIHQPLEGSFHRVEVFVNIGMIEFDRS